MEQLVLDTVYNHHTLYIHVIVPELLYDLNIIIFLFFGENLKLG